MKNEVLKRFLRYLKNENIIELYEVYFDKLFDLKSLLEISETTANEMMGHDNLVVVMKLYEIVNKIKINDEIKEYILTLTDDTLIKYSLRLATSNSIKDDNLKLSYIITMCEGNKENVKYAYGVIENIEINNDESLMKYVELIGNCNKDIAIMIRDLLLERCFLERKNLLSFITSLSYCTSSYIAEYMVNLYEQNENVPMEYLSILLCAKGPMQAKYAYEVLKNEKVMKRKDGLLIAITIASSEEDYQAYAGYVLTKDENVLRKENASSEILKAINTASYGEKLYNECELGIILENRDFDEVIRSLSIMPNEENITIHTKVKTK